MNRSSMLDYLRHSLTLLVIVSHSWPVLQGDNAAEPLMLLTNGTLTFGTFAVYCFFFLSGHLITQSYRRDPHAIRFTARRAARIIPGWIVAIAFSAVVGQLFNQFPDNPIPSANNASLWTLWWEALCYTIMVLARGHSAVMIILGGALYLNGFHGVVPFMLIAFGVGGMLPRLPELRLPRLPLDCSYGLYIYTFPIQQAVVATLGTHMPPLVLALLSLAISFPLSFASWRYLEQPFLARVSSRRPGYNALVQNHSQQRI